MIQVDIGRNCGIVGFGDKEARGKWTEEVRRVDFADAGEQSASATNHVVWEDLLPVISMFLCSSANFQTALSATVFAPIYPAKGDPASVSSSVMGFQSGRAQKVSMGDGMQELS